MAQQPNLFPPNPDDNASPLRSAKQIASEAAPPPWMGRVESLVRVVVQLYLGLLLVSLPWLAFWTQNNLWTYHPFLLELAANGFFRGVVSGLGVLNIVAALVNARRLA